MSPILGGEAGCGPKDMYACNAQCQRTILVGVEVAEEGGQGAKLSRSLWILLHRKLRNMRIEDVFLENYFQEACEYPNLSHPVRLPWFWRLRGGEVEDTQMI